MKKLLQSKTLGAAFVLVLLAYGSLNAQTSVQNFGTGTGAHTSGTGSTSFLPAPTSGTTWARGGAVVPNAPITLANTSNPLGTTGTYVRATAATTTSVAKFSPAVAYTGSAEFYTSFKILFGDSAAGNTAASGIWTFYQGTGAMYSDANDFAGAQVFAGLRFTYGAAGALALTTRQNASFVNTGLSPASFSQGTVYTIEIVGNNKASGTISYNYAGNAQTVAIQKYDLYINGTLVGNDIAEATLPAGTNVASTTFIGISSTSNAANVFVDDVIIYNAVPAFINVGPAAIPNAPVVSNPQISTLDVTIDSNAQNGNGAAIEYAIREAGSLNYVQANGSLGATAVWQTASAWGTKTVTGLLSNTLYSFAIKARNAAAVETSFSGTASGTTLNNVTANLSPGATTLAAFGNLCINTSATHSFSFNGANLNGSDIVVGALAGFSYSLTQNGTYTSTLNIPAGTTVTEQVAWVQFSPTLVQSYNGNIPLTGGGLAAPYNVAATGSGVNTPVAVTTGSASGTTSSGSTLAGSLVQGCSSVSAYGIEYSTTNGFVSGTGTQVAASNLLAGAFSVAVLGLNANTAYYFKAYATDGTGTVYGLQASFTTAQLPAPNATAATSIAADSFVANWGAVTGATSYALDVKTDPFNPAPAVTPWINEFHYDDNGTDANEFIEIVVPDAYAGTGLTLSLYNGSNNQTYATYTLAQLTLGQDTPVYNVYSISTAVDGIQNGAPDGFALSDSNGFIQFLSYEGTMTATNGPANTHLSVDVGVSENNSNEGASIHLTGTGSQYSDFTWSASAATNSNTKGNANTGQTIQAAVGGTYIIQDLNVGNNLSHTVSGLTENTAYYYRVRAVSASSTSPNSNIISVTTAHAAATFGDIAQVVGVVCDGSNATFNVNGLYPDVVSQLTYNINNGTPQTVNVSANLSGFGTFEIPLVFANNGQTLTVTSVDRTDFPGNPQTVTTNNTVVLSVNAYVAYYRDFDTDTFGDINVTIQACDGIPPGYVTDNTDCDDNNIAAHAIYPYYDDTDGDGYGSATVANLCAANPLVAPSGFSTNGNDCNDNAAAVHPGATEIGYNLIDDDCDGFTDEGFPPKNTVIQGAMCNTTLVAIDSQIIANLVAGGQGYRWRITTMSGPLTGQVQFLDTAIRSMKLTSLTSYAFNTQYKVEVAVYYAGFLQPFLASNCTVTTPAATSALSVCGQTLTSMSNVVYASLVPYAAGYRFRITDPLNVGNTQVIDRPLREFRMNLVTNFLVQWNKSYNVEVALKNTDGTYLPYGSICSVTTPLFPTTSLQDAQCDNYPVANSSTLLYAVSYQGAIAYAFQVTGPGLGSPLEVIKPTRTFTLNDFPGLIAGATYNVRVRLIFNMSEPAGPYGKVCTIVTPGLSRQAKTKASFDAVAYPNPFASDFNIDITTSQSQDIQVKVYDMMGRLLDNQNVKTSGITSFTIGDSYPSGIYNIIVSQGDEVKNLRVIKR
jgi:hypothetical protein